jgi:hypothetical protein
VHLLVHAADIAASFPFAPDPAPAGGTNGTDVLTNAEVSYPSWVPVANAVGLILLAAAVGGAVIGLGMLYGIKKGGTVRQDLEKVGRVLISFALIALCLGGGTWIAAKTTASWSVNQVK